MRKNLIYVVLIVTVGAVFAIPSSREFLKKTFLPVATVENAATISDEDFDLDLKGINTASTNLKNLRDKTIFLNYWGTWCAPCRKEWPTIQAMYDTRKDKMNFVLIAMKDEEENVVKYLKENNYNVPVYIAQSPISEKILPKAFPTTFLLDKSGRILLKEDAYKDWNSESSLEFIDAATKKY